MSRANRGDQIDPREVQIIHAISRCTRACRLFGSDPISGNNYDHRKGWVEAIIRRFATNFAIDVLTFSVMSSHHHQVLRSRPDIVGTWDDTEVAERWLRICPVRKDKRGNPKTPTKAELDAIRNDPDRCQEIRLRLSDISWWMRLLNQRIAQRANREDEAKGRFFEDRFKGIPVIDEAGLAACTAYVDLNWVRACMAETLEMSDHTSAQRRIEALKDPSRAARADVSQRRQCLSDSFLAPVDLREGEAPAGPQPAVTADRCSDKGFLSMETTEYLELLDWSARQSVPGKPGRTPESLPPLLRRLGLSGDLWLELVSHFDELFTTMAGRPENIDNERGKKTGRRFHVSRRTRELFEQAA